MEDDFQHQPQVCPHVHTHTRSQTYMSMRIHMYTVHIYVHRPHAYACGYCIRTVHTQISLEGLQGFSVGTLSVSEFLPCL